MRGATGVSPVQKHHNAMFTAQPRKPPEKQSRLLAVEAVYQLPTGDTPVAHSQ